MERFSKDSLKACDLMAEILRGALVNSTKEEIDTLVDCLTLTGPELRTYAVSLAITKASVDTGEDIDG